ncbi:tryptophan synthase subunit alpha [Pseudosporangium ferrugineum]|uniref:Tryptophan synthase alpha chain n=1 Tax=Pseudosporangium ferrugineum TaxID=439699 RepID=A0A2T0SFU1_9ACTN|nr:tryptophan synthase subunit alpha [Pseudosporangium ferrugineum]PRY32279.1 tryptophan synthase alpha chain [Pseudosporangium ferrugineum]
MGGEVAALPGGPTATPGSRRISLGAALRAARRPLLVPYVTGGVTEAWIDYVLACQNAGADAIEVGLPFSDPMLDGTTIQQASDRALARGATVDGILADLAAATGRLRVPIIVMTYANLALRVGVRRLADAGVSGLIVPDLPLEESAELEGEAAAVGIDLVLLAAPATPDDRLREICARSRGFVYAISVMGTTGERDRLSATAADLVRRVWEAATPRTRDRTAGPRPHTGTTERSPDDPVAEGCADRGQADRSGDGNFRGVPVDGLTEGARGVPVGRVVRDARGVPAGHVAGEVSGVPVGRAAGVTRGLPTGRVGDGTRGVSAGRPVEDEGAQPSAAAHEVRAGVEGPSGGGGGLPVLIGFGVSTPEQAAEAGRAGDGVIVGAALMRRVLSGASADDLRDDVAALRAALDLGVSTGTPHAEISGDRR